MEIETREKLKNLMDEVNNMSEITPEEMYLFIISLNDHLEQSE